MDVPLNKLRLFDKGIGYLDMVLIHLDALINYFVLELFDSSASSSARETHPKVSLQISKCDVLGHCRSHLAEEEFINGFPTLRPPHTRKEGLLLIGVAKSIRHKFL